MPRPAPVPTSRNIAYRPCTCGGTVRIKRNVRYGFGHCDRCKQLRALLMRPR